MTRVCVFDRRSGARIDDLPESALLPRITRDGSEYRRHCLAVLSEAKTIHEAVVYSEVSLTPVEEFIVFETLFPNRGGVFQIEPVAD